MAEIFSLINPYATADGRWLLAAARRIAATLARARERDRLRILLAVSRQDWMRFR